MPTKPGDSIIKTFQISAPSTGALVNADSTPTGTLVRNGTDDGTVTVTITNLSTGDYESACTVPNTYAANDDVEIRINATISANACAAVIWRDRLIGGTLPTVGTGANQIAVDGAGNVSLSTGAVTAVQNGLATSASQATILNRLGSFAGTTASSIFAALRKLGGI